MPALTYPWVTVADTAVDPDSPLDATLMTALAHNQVHLREWIGADFFAGAVKNHIHDGVGSALIAVGGNLLRNGSFEDGESGWTFADFSGGSHAISTSTHRDGAKALQITSTVLANGGGTATSNEYLTIGGRQSVSLKFWLWASVANVSSKAEVIWYDNTQAQISASVVKSFTATPSAPTHHAAVVAAPDSARYYRLRFTGGVPASGTATGSVFVDGVHALSPDVEGAQAQDGIPVGLIKAGSLNQAQGTTIYARAVGQASTTGEANAQCQDPAFPYVCDELRLFASAAVPSGQSVTATLRKNGADTALTCTINGPGQYASITGTPVTFAAGDLIAVKIVSSAAAGTNTYNATVRTRQPGRSDGYPAIFQNTSTLNNCLTEFGGAASSAETTVQIPLGPCLVSHWSGSLAAAGSALTADSYATRREGAALLVPDLLGSWIRFDEMDLWAVRHAGAPALVIDGNTRFRGFGATDYDPCPLPFSALNVPIASTVFANGWGYTNSATEAPTQVPMPACIIRNLRVAASAAPAGGETWTVTVRKNGVDTAVSCVLTSAAGRKASDLANAAVFADGDLLSVKIVSSTNPGVQTLNLTLEPFAG
jgi:hypothetical protein